MKTIQQLARGFGRPPAPSPRSAPARAHHALGDVGDDVVAQIKGSAAWNQMIDDAANKGYEAVKSRFEADKEQFANEIVSTAAGPLKQLASETVEAIKPQVQADLYAIYDDAQTQARIGQTQTEFRNALIQVAAVGGLATALLTFGLIRYGVPR